MISIIFDVDDTLYDQIMPFREAAMQAGWKSIWLNHRMNQLREVIQKVIA